MVDREAHPEATGLSQGYSTQGASSSSCGGPDGPSRQDHMVVDLDDSGFAFPVPAALEGVKSRSKAIIRLENVSFQYPKSARPAIANVSLTVSQVSRVAVRGPSGAGKSTLLKVVGGLCDPTEGAALRVRETRVAHVTDDSFKRLKEHGQLTPTQYILWRFEGNGDKERDAGKVDISVAMKKPAVEVVEEHLAHFGLDATSASHVKIKQLSDGLQAALVLAAATWRKPQVLILDAFEDCLDGAAAQALVVGLQRFQGGVILCCNDNSINNAVTAEKWTLRNGTLRVEGGESAPAPTSTADTIRARPVDSATHSKKELERAKIKELEEKIRIARMQPSSDRNLQEISEQLHGLKTTLLNDVMLQDPECPNPEDYSLSGLGQVIDDQLREILMEEFGANLKNFYRTQKEYGLKLSLLLDQNPTRSQDEPELDLLGFLAYKTWGPPVPCVSIGAVGVAAKHRGKGYGRNLMKVAEDRAALLGRQEGDQFVQGQVRLRALATAVKFYERLGYERIEEEDDAPAAEKTPGCPDLDTPAQDADSDDEEEPCVPMVRRMAPFSPRTMERMTALLDTTPQLDPWSPKKSRALEDGPTWPSIDTFKQDGAKTAS